jgi:hypothetical protein
MICTCEVISNELNVEVILQGVHQQVRQVKNIIITIVVEQRDVKRVLELKMRIMN